MPVALKHRAISRQEKMAFSASVGLSGLPSPSHRVWRRTDVRMYGRTDGRSRDYYVTTKISRIDRLPYFLSNGAPLAGFARRLRYKFTKLRRSVGGEVQQKLWICWRSLSGQSATVLHRNSKADVSIVSALSQELKLEKSPLEFLAWPIHPLKSVDKSKCLHFPQFSMQPIKHPNILTAAIKLANFGWLLQMLTPVKIKLGNRFSY